MSDPQSLLLEHSAPSGDRGCGASADARVVCVVPVLRVTGTDVVRGTTTGCGYVASGEVPWPRGRFVVGAGRIGTGWAWLVELDVDVSVAGSSSGKWKRSSSSKTRSSSVP